MRVYQLNGLKLNLDESEECLVEKAARALNIPKSDIALLSVIRKALDARRNRPPHFVYAVKIILSGQTAKPENVRDGVELRTFQEEPAIEPVFQAGGLMPRDGGAASGRRRSASLSGRETQPIVVGSGPAGLFAAYTLAVKGMPVTLLERGRPVEKRIDDVERFWKSGTLDPRSNVLFGEGGAGTFSDGKLTSRSKNPYSGWVKKVLTDMGAPASILTDAKPHIGTDRLRGVLVNLRHKLIEMGCSIRFEAQVTDFIVSKGAMAAVAINHEEEMPARDVILAMGQSADDTYRILNERGVKMEPKPFAMGLRVEHPQALINEIQYGRWAGHPQLPPAEYFVTAAVREYERSVYTFCMCPGGQVIGCSAFPGGVVVNGMSNRRRDGEFANSAVVVNVKAEDFLSRDLPLGGLNFRKHWEQKAFAAGGGNYEAPCQRLTDFLGKNEGGAVGRTSFLPGVKPAVLSTVLPDFVTEALRAGLKQIDLKMPGFVSADAHLIGVETRTSSPVRICRGADGGSETVLGLYPCGEGAGYAGGIISSALDGVKAALNLMAATGGRQ